MLFLLGKKAWPLLISWGDKVLPARNPPNRTVNAHYWVPRPSRATGVDRHEEISCGGRWQAMHHQDPKQLATWKVE